MEWYLKVISKYVDFSGRARRKEYWMFVLFNSIFATFAIVLDNILGITIGELFYGPVYILYALFVFLPGLAVSVRRLHDIGKSGAMVLISFIPVVGSIWLLVLMVTESYPEDNQYGAATVDSAVAFTSYIDKNEEQTTEKSNGDIMILIIVCWMFVYKLFWVIIPIVYRDFYSNGLFMKVNGILNFVWALAPFGLAFATKDKSKRIVIFVISGLYLILEITGIFRHMF